MPQIDDSITSYFFSWTRPVSTESNLSFMDFPDRQSILGLSPFDSLRTTPNNLSGPDLPVRKRYFHR